MKLRQADNYSPVFELVIDEQTLDPESKKVPNVDPHSHRCEKTRNIITEIQNRSFESCQGKQREREEKIREFQQQCNREFEDFQRRVNRDRDSLLRCVMSLSVPDSQPQIDRTTTGQRLVTGVLGAGAIDQSGSFLSADPRFPANQQSELMRLNRQGVEDAVMSAGDLEDLDMIYGNEELDPAFEASDDSNSSNDSVSRRHRNRALVRPEVAQSAPMKVPTFHRRKSTDSDDDVDDNIRPFDFRRMTLEAASLSRFTNKSVVSDGTELFGPFPEANNPPM